jgi:hypothetical protein
VNFAPIGKSAYKPPVRRLGDRGQGNLFEESPGSTERRCRLTAGGGDPRDSATEMTPPTGPVFFGRLAAARLKWCGKSAPRLWQQRRHGKPHREQDQIGTARDVFRIAVRVGRVRCVATCIPEEWSSSHFGDGQNPAYRPSDSFSLAPNCLPRGKPSEDIFPHQRLCRAGEESLSQAALPRWIKGRLFRRRERRARPSPFRSSLSSSLPHSVRAPDRAGASARPVRRTRL